MNTNKTSLSKRAIISAAAAIVLAGVCAAHGQDSAEKSGDAFVTPVAYTSQDRRDPFEAYVVEEAIPVSAVLIEEEENVALPALKISGITWGSSFSQAIINDKIVKAGDMVDEVTVVSITKEGLVFSFRNKQFVLPAPGATATGAQKPDENIPRRGR